MATKKETREVDADGNVWMVSADGTSRRSGLGALSELYEWKGSYDDTSIGGRIRHARDDAKITQAEFSKLIDVSQSAVGSWEKDQTMPKKDTMKTIAELLDVSEFWLWFGDLPDDVALDAGADPTPMIQGGPTQQQVEVRDDIIEDQKRELEALKDKLNDLMVSEEQRLHSVNKTKEAADKVVEESWLKFEKMAKWEEPGFAEYMDEKDLQNSGGAFLGAIEGKYGPIAMQQAQLLQNNIQAIDGGIRLDDPKPTGNVNIAPEGVSAETAVGNAQTIVQDIPLLEVIEGGDDIPILGTAAGAGPEGPAFQFNRTDRIGIAKVNRRTGMYNAKDLFAIQVVGNSMSPKHEDGDILIVSFRRRAVVGETVIVQVYADPNEQETSEVRAYVKVLEKRNDDSYVLKQFNPEVSTITIPKSHVKYLDRVVPEQELLGFK